MVISMVEKYAFDHPSAGRPRWVGPMLREAGVPWQAIWESMDELFTTKVCCFSFILKIDLNAFPSLARCAMNPCLMHF